LDDPKIWLFTIGGNDSPPTVTAQDLLSKYDPNTYKNDTKYNTDFAFGWYCDSVRYIATLGSNKDNFTTYAPEAIAKAFHPKTAAFTDIKDHHKEAIRRLGWPRPINVDQGILQCKPSGRQDGDEQVYASRDDMVNAASDFCTWIASTGKNPGILDGVYHKQHVSATKNENATDCPPIDVTSKDFVDICKSRLMNAVDGCKCLTPPRLRYHYPQKADDHCAPL
jgi:hypothetical protein